MLQKSASAAGHYEPSLSFSVLPACHVCGGKHPLAYVPPQPDDQCPECGAPAYEPGAPRDVPAVITDGRLRLGSALMRVGAFFHRIAGRL